MRVSIARVSKDAKTWVSFIDREYEILLSGLNVCAEFGIMKYTPCAELRLGFGFLNFS